MAAASGLMAVAMGTQALNTATTSYNQSQALKTQGAFVEQQATSEARIAGIQGQEALARGRKEAAAVRRRGAKLEGEQRAAAAGQGIDINNGSAAELQNETALFTDLDVMTVQNNAWREAWGFRATANAKRGAGKMARIGAEGEANSTLLTGGLQSLSYAAQAGYYSPDGKGRTRADNGMVAKERRRLNSEYERSMKSSSWPGLETRSKYLGVKY